MYFRGNGCFQLAKRLRRRINRQPVLLNWNHKGITIQPLLYNIHCIVHATWPGGFVSENRKRKKIRKKKERKKKTEEKLLKSLFLADGCPTSMLTLQSYQQTQASLSAGAGRFGLSSAEARKMSASVGFGSLVLTLPEVLADLSGATGDKVRRELPDSDLVLRIWSSVRGLRDVHGVSKEAMANIVPESWRGRAF